MDRLEKLIDKVKTAGLRLTPQRLVVLRILAESRDHLSAEQIYQQVRREFPTTSLATIYKTVAVLKEIGEVIEINVSGESSRFDGSNPLPHPHLICMRCQKIVDVDPIDLSELKNGLSRSSGFQINGQRLDFLGICPECQSNH